VGGLAGLGRDKRFLDFVEIGGGEEFIKREILH
jgi:hypothetical protein